MQFIELHKGIWHLNINKTQNCSWHLSTRDIWVSSRVARDIWTRLEHRTIPNTKSFRLQQRILLKIRKRHFWLQQRILQLDVVHIHLHYIIIPRSNTLQVGSYLTARVLSIIRNNYWITAISYAVLIITEPIYDDYIFTSLAKHSIINCWIYPEVNTSSHNKVI